MGSDLKDNIYISYPFLSWKKEEEIGENREKEYISKLCTHLKTNGERPIFQSQIHSIFLENNLKLTEISEIIAKIINQSYYIIVVLSPETIRSIHQAIEIEHFLEKKKKILYLLSDAEYTPEKVPELKTVIGTEPYFPFYDAETVAETCQKIIPLL